MHRAEGAGIHRVLPRVAQDKKLPRAQDERVRGALRPGVGSREAVAAALGDAVDVGDAAAQLHAVAGDSHHPSHGGVPVRQAQKHRVPALAASREAQIDQGRAAPVAGAHPVVAHKRKAEQQPSRDKQQEYAEKFMEVCEYINAHFSEDLKLEDVAEMAGFSKFHFTRLFKQFTGKTIARPKFEELINQQLQSGDTLIVCKLDRFARNVSEGVTTIKKLFNKGVRVHVLNVGLLENTAMGNFFITTLLAVAELERCMILERTASGKEIARMRSGYKEGRPKQITPEIIKQIKRCVLGGTGDQQDDVVQIQQK